MFEYALIIGDVLLAFLLVWGSGKAYDSAEVTSNPENRRYRYTIQLTVLTGETFEIELYCNYMYTNIADFLRYSKISDGQKKILKFRWQDSYVEVPESSISFIKMQVEEQKDYQEPEHQKRGHRRKRKKLTEADKRM